MNPKTRALRHAFTQLCRPGAVGIVTMTLAVLTCYGVLALTVLLPLLGIRLILDESLWSGAIVLFTVLTVIAVLPGIRVHGARMPAATAIAGGGLILYALFVEYHVLSELVGFVLLAAAVLRDNFLHRQLHCTEVSTAKTGSTPG